MINERAIERLIMIKRIKSISKAADEMHISRSSLVQQVKQIEEDMGFLIFDRFSYGITVTAAGERLLNDLQILQRHYANTIKTCREIQKNGSDCITIGSLPNLKSVLLQKACVDFSKSHPNVSFVFRDYPLSEYMQKFYNGDFDICAEYIMDYFVEDKDIEFKKIAETEYICGFPPGHKLFGRKNIYADDLKGERIILYNKGISRTADVLRVFLKRRDPDVKLIGIDSYDSNLYAKCRIENAGLMMYVNYESCFPQLSYPKFESSLKIELGIGFHRDCRTMVREFVECAAMSATTRD